MSIPVPSTPVPTAHTAESARRGSPLKIEGLGLQIGGATILKDVELDVAAGSLVGVIGPNGAGKTTLFNVISGLMKPTAGRITLDDRDITTASVPARARAGLGRTFQTSSIFPKLSVLENVRLAAQVSLGGSGSLLHFPRRTDAATELALTKLDAVGLTHKREAPAGDISHGDKRKLEIAVLLATEASIVLLDEPMAGVASGDVPGLVDNIRQMQREKGCTLLMVEHHIDVLMGLVEKVAVMYFGTIIAYDSPQRIMENPLVQSAYLGTGSSGTEAA
jgi:branched-chain amino acid transport system ATP-binding protein